MMEGQKWNSIFRNVAICTFYASTSVTLSFVNKYVLSAYNFKFYFTLLSCQLFCAFALCFTLRNVSKKWKSKIPQFEKATAMKCLPLSFVFVLNVGAGFVGLQMVNIPTFLCLRRTTTIFVLVMDYFIRGVVAPRPMRASLSVIAVGAVVAGWADMSGDVLGYGYVILNNLMTALYLSFTSKFSKDTGIKSFGLLYYNSMLALPMTLTLALVTNEFGGVIEYLQSTSTGFILALSTSSCLGVVLTYAMFLCTTVNSPVATSVTGNIKDLFSTTLGFVMFHEAKMTINLFWGLLISFTGSYVYSYLKLVQKGVVQNRFGFNLSERKLASGMP